jgi:hypothetical protein
MIVSIHLKIGPKAKPVDAFSLAGLQFAGCVYACHISAGECPAEYPGVLRPGVRVFL